MNVQKPSMVSGVAAAQAYQTHGAANTVRPAQQGTTPFKLEAAQAAPKSDDVITADERRFFQDLFPTSANEIGDYHAYTRDGSRTTAATGTVVDRKG